MAEGQIVSTTWDEGVDGSGSADGWRSYFRDGGNQPTAFQEIATKGRYTDETNSPLGLSASDNLLSDLTLNEANIVKMFNHLLEKHPRASETDTVADTQLTGTIGKIVKTARNFEAIASGSQVEVAVGDSIKVSVGDSYEYVDGSFDVKIGTGGYTREETRGDSTVENFVYGKKTEKTETTGDTDETTTTKGNVKSKTTTTGTTNENTTYIGRKEEFTLQVAGGAACTVGIGTATANEIQIGVFNSNTINVIGVAEIGVLVGGKLEISINLAASLKVTLGVTAEFETENFKAILKSDTVALQKFKATLKDDCADLVASKAALSDTNNKLTELNNKLTETSNKLSETKNALNTNTQALSLGMRCLAAQTQHLIKDDVVLFNSSKNAVNNMTSGITIIA